jgi:hypothetical protein
VKLAAADCDICVLIGLMAHVIFFPVSLCEAGGEEGTDAIT